MDKIHGEMVTSASTSYWSRIASSKGTATHHHTAVDEKKDKDKRHKKRDSPRHQQNKNTRHERIERIREENLKLKSEKTCRICCSAEVETVILPCRHIVCCERCVETVDHCPLAGCKQHILGHARVFFLIIIVQEKKIINGVIYATPYLSTA